MARWLVQAERPGLERCAPRRRVQGRAQGIGQRAELPRIAADEYGLHTRFNRFLRDQPAGVAGRAVDHQLRFHSVKLPRFRARVYFGLASGRESARPENAPGEGSGCRK